jgi:DNA primase catalytic core
MSPRQDDLPERIKEIVHLEDVIGEKVSLSRQGRELVGHHHIHESKSGTSLHVSPSKQVWICHNCKAGGDLFDWVMHHDHITFPDALECLAARAGIPLHAWTPEERRQQEVRRTDQELISRIFLAATNYYASHLTPEWQTSCLNRWGLTLDTLQQFRVGFAPVDPQGLWTFLRQAGWKTEALVKSGLFVRVHGMFLDFYQGRLIFPYWKVLPEDGHSGEVVYFIGRQTEVTPPVDWEKAKYRKLRVYDPDDEHKRYISPVVSNGHFFGEHALSGIHGKTLLVTEGIADALAAFQAGAICLSPVTTSFREADWPRLHHLCKHAAKVVIMNDNETSGAGKEGALKTARHLWLQQIDARIAELPKPDNVEKVDIAEFLKDHTPDTLHQLIDTAPTLLNLYLDKIAAAAPETQAMMAKEVYPLLAALNGVERHQAERALAKVLGVGLKAVRSSLAASITEPPRAHLIDADDDLRQELVKQVGLIRALANEIGKTSHFAQDVGEKLYRFHHGVYTPDGLSYVQRRVKSLLESWKLSALWSSFRATEVAEYLRVDAPTLWERPSRAILNLRNGLLDLDTRELTEHDPSYLSSVQIPVDYDTRASCGAWEAFVEEVFPKDALELAWEIIATVMCPDASMQRAILLQGLGGNGKSTYLRGVIAFIGRQNISSLSLHKLEQDRFSVAGLIGKLANICPDLPSTHLEETGTFKAITGGDYVRAEYKYQESFDFLPFAKLLFSANHFPRSSDDSEAFFDRWHVIPFERSFRGTPSEKPRETLDAQLADPNQLSGVLNKALGALTRLRSQGLSITDSMTHAWEEFRRTTDPMTVWLDRMTVQLSDAIVAKDVLLNEYNKDCQASGRPRISAHAMTKTIKRAYPSVTEAQRTVIGGYKWCWIGLGLAQVTENTTKNEQNRTVKQSTD